MSASANRFRFPGMTETEANFLGNANGQHIHAGTPKPALPIIPSATRQFAVETILKHWTSQTVDDVIRKADILAHWIATGTRKEQND